MMLQRTTNSFIVVIRLALFTLLLQGVVNPLRHRECLGRGDKGWSNFLVTWVMGHRDFRLAVRHAFGVLLAVAATLASKECTTSDQACSESNLMEREHSDLLHDVERHITPCYSPCINQGMYCREENDEIR